MKKTAALCCAAVLMAAATISAPAHAFEWVDDEVTVSFGPTYAEPGVASGTHPRGSEIAKEVVTFTHADGFAYGTNFVNVDILKSSGADPANNSTAGAIELYGIYRNVLSGNKISGTNNFAFGPVQDVGWETGGDLETKDTTFAPNKKLFVVGPQFSLVIPSYLGGKDGFFNISLHFSKEWNNNGIVGKPVDFDPAFEMETGWSLPMPFTLGGYPVAFKGFANLVSPKGRDGFGDETKTEILVHPKMMVNLGELIHGNKDRLEVGIGFEYWYNKFGNDHTKTPGAIEMTPLILATYKF
jgi:nucleoside-specific outer membrane channel protein Tsx